MWENIKISLKDKNFRLKAIAVLVVAFIIISFVLWFSFSVDAAIISVDMTYYMGVLTDYGGTYLPTVYSNGLPLSTGVYSRFGGVSFDNSDGTVNQRPYIYLYFDFSSLDLSYNYDITFTVLQGNGLVFADFSFDGFLTSSSISSYPSTTISWTRYYSNVIKFSSSGYSNGGYSNSSGSNSSARLVSFYLNDHLDSNNVFTIGFRRGNYNDSNFVFGVIVTREQTPSERIISSIENYSGGSSEYVQILDDISSGLLDDTFDSSTASFFVDLLSSKSNSNGVSSVEEIKLLFDSVINNFINSSSGLSGSALADSFESYNSQLYNYVQTFMTTISSPEEASALSSLYDVASRQLEQIYQSIGSSYFYNSLGQSDSSYQSYHQYEQDILDRVNSVNVNNSLNLSSWVNTLSAAETSSFKSLFDGLMSNYSWSIFIQVPIFMTIIISLLGTSRNKEG